MPLEIRELVISTVVQETPSSPTANISSPSSSTGNDAVVAACVEQVLEILQQKTER
jgi:hypothetical protein